MKNFRGFPCSLCKKWVKERFAYIRDKNYTTKTKEGWFIGLNNQPCPECGKITGKIVVLIDCDDDDIRRERKIVSCSECIPAMGDISYVWCNDRVCHRCFSCLKSGQEWAPGQRWTPIGCDQKTCKSHHCHRCGKETNILDDKLEVINGVETLVWRGNSSDFENAHRNHCHGACNGAGQNLENVPSSGLGKSDNLAGLIKENQELRQQLAQVQKQLVEVLEELKKLKGNLTGKDNKKITQQITENKRLIKESKNDFVAEIQKQVNKSKALIREVKVNAAINGLKTREPNKFQKLNDNKGIGLITIGVIGVVLIIGLVVVKKRLNKKVKE